MCPHRRTRRGKRGGKERMSRLNEGSVVVHGVGGGGLRRRMTVGLAVVMALLISAVSAAPSFAAEINITTFADGPATEDGVCTFREAIDEANSDIQGTSPDCHFTGTLKDDIINLPAGTLKIQGAQSFNDDENIRGDFDVYETTGHGLTVSGAGRTKTTIDGNGKSRLFDVYNTLTSIIGERHLTFNNIRLTGGVDSGPGGAIDMANAISDDSRLVL